MKLKCFLYYIEIERSERFFLFFLHTMIMIYYSISLLQKLLNTQHLLQRSRLFQLIPSTEMPCKSTEKALWQHQRQRK
jgi:hypothetical protein